MIWYSAINEDSEPEYQQLVQWDGKTLVVIAGSGERVMALLDAEHIEHVIIVDQEPDALELTHVKIEALRSLGPEAYLELMGHIEATTERRRSLWTHLGRTITLPNIDVSQGLHHVGRVEQWFATLRPLLHRWLGKTFSQWARSGMPAPPPKKFPVIRFRLLMWIFRHKISYIVTGNQDPAFVGSRTDHNRIADAFLNNMKQGTLQNNPMAQLVFVGHLRGMSKETLPRSYDVDVLRRIHERLDDLRITYVLGDVTDPTLDRSLEWTEGKAPVFSSLSDLVSFIDPSACSDVVRRATRNPGSQAIVRRFVRNSLTIDDDAVDLSIQERTGMYDVRSYTSVPTI